MIAQRNSEERGAIYVMKRELRRIETAMVDCVNDYGLIKPGKVSTFTTLVQKSRAFKESIDWLDDLYQLEERGQECLS